MSDISYIAGFFDGEGCIQISTQRHRGGYFLAVSCDNVVKAPLTIMKKFLGGKITEYMNSSGRPIYRWYAYGDKAAASLTVLCPFLVVKKKQAQIAIVFQASKSTKSRDWQGQQQEKLRNCPGRRTFNGNYVKIK